MRTLNSFIHPSLDGLTAGPREEMDWITMDDEILSDLIALQSMADTALLAHMFVKSQTLLFIRRIKIYA
jgi:hypothetical protein